MPSFSFIIPVYNRSEELEELLFTLSKQTFRDFEVVIVEDGSQHPCNLVIDKYSNELQITYLKQENKGPGPARNTGAKSAKGRWLIFVDSDCLLPENYLEIVNENVDSEDFDCFGGPDRPHPNFNTIQKAIGYAMSSVLTTGGIRGAKEKLDIFYPRSYNLGVRQSVFKAMGGFSDMRFGEDLDFSMRLLKKGYSTRLIKEAFVFHKRRNNFRSFFKQVYNSGIARINLEIRHKGTLKPVHTIPSLFVGGHLFIIILAIFASPWYLLLFLVVPITVMSHAMNETGEIRTSVWAVAAAYTQTFGYGLGFIEGLIVRKILGKKEFHAFSSNFYK
ncbi:glycosyltransferase [Alkalitalea saponilacus]|uniref:Glycosyl transferase family 2 n=1 Tax=Alkalitalea saponilacus TaxID=889453 RepID=A0A1T5HBH2_9BACT|nr:glycosyltransferase [Alkalitalea saponilacus]ASB50787.1 glycosyl transferase family 2 [Alkalitalea saponilacus]SKC17881.1 Glycosyl transferase family 2 [Alkalitalea saponilacus]